MEKRIGTTNQTRSLSDDELDAVSGGGLLQLYGAAGVVILLGAGAGGLAYNGAKAVHRYLTD